MSAIDIDDGPDFVTLDRAGQNADAAALAAYALSLGSLVVLPTDTVYGLAARAFDRIAVTRVFEAKRRDPTKKLPLLIAEPEDLGRYARDSDSCAERLARKHWPGALTIVVSAAEEVPLWLVDKRGTVALRCPDHDLVREVARRLGEPLAATSVNFPGAPDATRVEDIPGEILESVDLVLDGGPTAGVPSTVVDCTASKPAVLRSGAVLLDV